MRIDPAFGDDESFSRLCREAEARGISILLDGVFNHTGADSRYFDIYSRYGGGAYKNPDSPIAAGIISGQRMMNMSAGGG